MDKKISRLPLTFGIASLVTWIIPILGVIVGTIGIVISKKQIKVLDCKAYRIGLILSSIGIGISALYCIVNICIIIKFM